MLVEVMDTELVEVVDTEETMGSCTTSFDEELWAFRYELPPPRI